MFATGSISRGSPALAATRGAPWRVLIVDDDQEVHSLTRLALRDCECLDRRIEFLGAQDGRQAREVLRHNADIAVAFIDVVMETDRAGLDLVSYIREDMKNQSIRLILRTGQPGVAPERQVIRDYDINDYIAKASVSSGKLYTATLTALRAFNHITSLEQTQHRLERYRDGLETMVGASASLFEVRSLHEFAKDLLSQLGTMLQRTRRSLIVQVSGLTVSCRDGRFEVLAKAGRFESRDASSLESDVLDRLELSLRERRCVVHDDVFVGYFPARNGVVNLVYLDGAGRADELDVRLLDLFSRSIGVAFDSLYLDRERLDVQGEVIMILCELVESRSHDASSHVRRVAALSRLLAQAIGLSDAECDAIFLVAPLHDLGKVAIPDAIRFKEGALSEAEWAVMKCHAAIGRDVFSRSRLEIMRAAAAVAGQHHECYDGSGYPDGLSGEDIHVFARIVAVVDAFDALLHKRCYKDAWPLEKVVEQLRAGRGLHFDARIVDAFLEHLDEALAVIEALPDRCETD